MRGRLCAVMVALVSMSCSKEDFDSGNSLDYSYGRELKHEMIVLGDRLENPYTTENMTKALESLYPTKADRVDIRSTDLYVRFLPADEQEYELLNSLGLTLVDHPMDYDILVEGDWYHDPEVSDGKVTWQYAVVPPDFDFPDICHEVIDECYISEHDPATRSDGSVDWEAVERQSYILTGNSARLSDPLTKASSKVIPSGRITIVDSHANGGKAFGVAGVKVSCNSFVKFDHCHTDRDGYYQMSKQFSANLRYRLIFENEKDFSIGLNLILVPASVSTLGKSGPEGVNMTVTPDSEEKLFSRCVVNNAVYDYISRCASSDLDISVPPSDLRLWLFPSFKSSSAVMLHHGAFVRSELISRYLGTYTGLLEFFMPDITIGLGDKDEYREIYSTTCHELAHSSHFRKAGIKYWNGYISDIIESFIKTGGDTYGDGTSAGHGLVEVGEMWAYYLESRMFKDRYGGSFPSFGTSFWFYPQIFRFLDERGFSPSDIFSVLGPEVTSKQALKAALLSAFPGKRTVIEQVFNRY